MSAVLLVIDMQKAMDHPKYGRRNNPSAENNIAKLLRAWRAKKWSIIYVQDCSPDPTSPFYPGQPLHEFKDEIKPYSGEQIVKKDGGNGFQNTELHQHIIETGLSEILITGCHTQYCVTETATAAITLGFKTVLVSDALVSIEMQDGSSSLLSPDAVHEKALQKLKERGAIIRETNDFF